MSQTQPQQVVIPPYVPDPYLLAAAMPPNDLTVDPQYHNARIVTPIGRLFYVHVDKPHAIIQPGKPPGAPKFTATLGMNPAVTMDLYKTIMAVADMHWPSVQRADPSNPGGIVNLTGSQMLTIPPHLGGFHYPLRSGDEAFSVSTKPLSFAHWRGLYFINTSVNPKTKQGADRRPISLDELGNPTDPARFYPGCYARLKVTVATFSNSGNNGITFFLDAIQFARHGEPIKTGFDQEGAARNAFAAAGALPVAEPVNLGAFGPNSAGPGSIPPGMAMPGFAPPPPVQGQSQPGYPPQAQPQHGYPPQAQPQAGYIPPQQPQQAWAPAAPAMARPPGV
jgi:ssDNA-binding protein